MRTGHILCTGQSNKLILENLRFLNDSGVDIEVRIPFVPTLNDDLDSLNRMGGILSGLNR